MLHLENQVSPPEMLFFHRIFNAIDLLGVDGEIWSIGICDEPLPTFGGLQVFIDSDGVVTLKASSDD